MVDLTFAEERGESVPGSSPSAMTVEPRYEDLMPVSFLETFVIEFRLESGFFYAASLCMVMLLFFALLFLGSSCDLGETDLLGSWS